MKILIVGSNGFIGSNAVEYFTAKGYTVIECDVVEKTKKNYHTIRNTATDFDTIFKQYAFDICLNASGLANVQVSFQEPRLDYELNVQNVYALLSGIKNHNPACRFINFSSAAVYGNPLKLPVHEEEKIQPISPYGLHKYYSELICKEFNEYFNIKTCTLRVFSAYGAGLRKQLFWDLYQKQKKENFIELSGTGNETRDFIYISDLLFAIECVIKNAAFNGECINVANGEQENISAIANYFVKLFSEEKEIKFIGNTRAGDPQNWCADITALKKMGYIKKINMAEGLINYKDWVEKNS